MKVMIIAGTDSSGGAGLTRDTAVANAMGLEVLPVVTSVTVQTDIVVREVHTLPEEFVAKQIEAALDSGPIHAVKIGMLGTVEIAEQVANALASITAPIVLDPVLRSSSGKILLSGRLPQRLISQADVVLPNLAEAAVLTSTPMATEVREIANQAKILINHGAQAVLIKGGHGREDICTDHLFRAFGHQHFDGPRLTIEKRGTGCTLATAIACCLASGQNLAQACEQAKAFVSAWLKQADRA